MHCFTQAIQSTADDSVKASNGINAPNRPANAFRSVAKMKRIVTEVKRDVAKMKRDVAEMKRDVAEMFGNVVNEERNIADVLGNVVKGSSKVVKPVKNVTRDLGFLGRIKRTTVDTGNSGRIPSLPVARRPLPFVSRFGGGCKYASAYGTG